jgi:hypothetical protein
MSEISDFFGKIQKQLDVGSEIFQKSLETVSAVQKTFLEGLGELFDLLVDIINIFIDLVVAMTPMFQYLPYFIPIGVALFVGAKISQVFP